MADPVVTVDFDLATAEDMQQQVYAYIQGIYPDWSPREGSLEVAQTEAFTILLFELFNLATDVGPQIFQYLGKLIKVDPIDAAPATFQATITANDTDGHIISDLLVGFDLGDDSAIGFELVNSVTIAPGDSATPAGAATFRATTDGSVGNGLGSTPQVITLYDFLDSDAVVPVAPSANGLDAESIDDYLARLSTRLQLLTDRPIRGSEVALYIATLFPTVGRALGFDNYNSDTGDNAVERHVSWTAHDEVGDDLDTDTVNLINTSLALTRELNFNFHYFAPTRFSVAVTAEIEVEEGWDQAAVVSNVKSSLVGALNATLWGQPSSPQGPQWFNRTVLENGWVYAQIVRVEGVRRVIGNVNVNVNGGADYTTDINLPGTAPLPSTAISPSDMTITVAS